MVDVNDSSKLELKAPSHFPKISEDFRCPPDKSFTHRAVIFASLAEGKSDISHPLLGEDCLATIATFRKLGVTINIGGEILEIQSPGVKGWQLAATHEFDFGNSGTTTRLLLGLFAGVAGLKARCSGDASLQSRPMKRVTQFLREMGAIYEGEAEYLPIALRGTKLTPGHFHYNKASAQVKSALMMAAFHCAGEQIITLPKGGRDHTERFIRALGGRVKVSLGSENEIITFTGPFTPAPFKCAVPGDPSSAAFIFALHFFSAQQHCVISKVMHNPTRSGFFSVLERMGAKIEYRNQAAAGMVIEEIFDYAITAPDEYRAVDISSDDVPAMIDEVPILALILSFIDGESVIRGLDELRVKESDRLQETVELIRATGGQCRIDGDDLYISGKTRKSAQFEYDSKGDHRMAMAAICAALTSEKPSVVKSVECIKVSFPNFLEIAAKFFMQPMK